MNSQHRAIRAQLKEISPQRAVKYIQAFDLPIEEALFLIEIDVRRKSCVQAAIEHKTSVEVVKSRRRSAYKHIADQINNGIN